MVVITVEPKLFCTYILCVCARTRKCVCLRVYSLIPFSSLNYLNLTCSVLRAKRFEKNKINKKSAFKKNWLSSLGDDFLQISVEYKDLLSSWHSIGKYSKYDHKALPFHSNIISSKLILYIKFIICIQIQYVLLMYDIEFRFHWLWRYYNISSNLKIQEVVSEHEINGKHYKPETAKAVAPSISTRLAESGWSQVMPWLTADFSLKMAQIRI